MATVICVMCAVCGQVLPAAEGSLRMTASGPVLVDDVTWLYMSEDKRGYAEFPVLPGPAPTWLAFYADALGLGDPKLATAAFYIGDGAITPADWMELSLPAVQWGGIAESDPPLEHLVPYSLVVSSAYERAQADGWPFLGVEFSHAPGTPGYRIFANSVSDALPRDPIWLGDTPAKPLPQVGTSWTPEPSSFLVWFTLSLLTCVRRRRIR